VPDLRRRPLIPAPPRAPSAFWLWAFAAAGGRLLTLAAQLAPGARRK